MEQGASSLTVYQRLNLPVISDRDFVLRVTWGADGQAHWITYRAVKATTPPPREGVVRVTHHSGSWLLEPARGGQETIVRYEVTIDLAGWLPRWMAKSGSGKELPELFVAIQKMIAHPETQAKSQARRGPCLSKCS